MASAIGFEVGADVAPGETYYVLVRAISKTDALGPESNPRQFQGAAETHAGPQVPWPARPLPPEIAA